MSVIRPELHASLSRVLRQWGLLLLEGHRLWGGRGLPWEAGPLPKRVGGCYVLRGGSHRSLVAIRPVTTDPAGILDDRSTDIRSESPPIGPKRSLARRGIQHLGHAPVAGDFIYGQEGRRGRDLSQCRRIGGLSSFERACMAHSGEVGDVLEAGIARVNPNPEPAAVSSDDWDAALHLEDVYIAQGREEGLREGRVRGFEDGMQQGLRQGCELGQEIGWYWGCCVVWDALVAERSATGLQAVPDRAKRSLMQLQSLIRTFPLREALQDDGAEGATEGAGDASLEEHLKAVRAKFSSTASAFGASPKRPVFSTDGAGAGGTPQAAAAAPVGSLDF